MVALFLLSAALFGLLSFILLLNTSFLETPKDKFLTRELDVLKIQYSILNKKMDQLDDVIGSIEDRDNNLYRIYFKYLCDLKK